MATESLFPSSHWSGHSRINASNVVGGQGVRNDVSEKDIDV